MQFEGFCSLMSAGCERRYDSDWNLHVRTPVAPSSMPTFSPTFSAGVEECTGICKGEYPFGCAIEVEGKTAYRCHRSGGCFYAVQPSSPSPYDGFCQYYVDETQSSITISPSPAHHVEPSLSPTVASPDSEQLVFIDEFEGDTLDLTKWDIEVNCWGGGNAERQCYTARSDNVYVEGGALHLRAIRENYRGTLDDCTLNAENSCEWEQAYTSGRVRTLKSPDGSWLRGRFVIRAKLPAGRGLWPAIWMLPTDSEFGGWAASGEIDIMEARGQEVDRVEGTLHYSSAWPNNRFVGSGPTTFPEIDDFTQAFHDFQFEWTETSMAWSVDGSLYHREELNRNFCESPGCPYLQQGEPWNKRFHLLLNLAVGGNFLAGPSGEDHLAWTRNELVVDSVKVYQVSFNAPPEPTPGPHDCTREGEDPYAGGHFVQCCEGTGACVGDWTGDGRYSYLCAGDGSCPGRQSDPTPHPTSQCTGEGDDPYGQGTFRQCCADLAPCLDDWGGGADWFYLCIRRDACPNRRARFT